MIIDAADLDPTSSYKLLIGSVLPRAIAWVSTSSTTGVGNIAPVSFFTVVGQIPTRTLDLLAAPLRRRHAQGHVRQHPRHERVRRQHRHDRPGRRCAPVRLRIRHRRRRVRGTGPGEGSLGHRFPHPASPMRRSPSNASSTASFRCRRCPTTSCGDGSSASTSATISTCPSGRIDVGALGVFGRLAGEYTMVDNIFTTPLPDDLVEELDAHRAEPPRRARQ